MLYFNVYNIIVNINNIIVNIVFRYLSIRQTGACYAKKF